MWWVPLGGEKEEVTADDDSNNHNGNNNNKKKERKAANRSVNKSQYTWCQHNKQHGRRRQWGKGGSI